MRLPRTLSQIPLLALLLAAPADAVTLSNVHWQQTPFALVMKADVRDAPQQGLNQAGGWTFTLALGDHGPNTADAHWLIMDRAQPEHGFGGVLEVYDQYTNTNPMDVGHAAVSFQVLTVALPVALVGTPAHVFWWLVATDITPASSDGCCAQAREGCGCQPVYPPFALSGDSDVTPLSRPARAKASARGRWR